MPRIHLLYFGGLLFGIRQPHSPSRRSPFPGHYHPLTPARPGSLWALPIPTTSTCLSHLCPSSSGLRLPSMAPSLQRGSNSLNFHGNSWVVSVLSSPFYRWKILRHGGVKSLAQGHTISRRWRWDSSASTWPFPLPRHCLQASHHASLSLPAYAPLLPSSRGSIHPPTHPITSYPHPSIRASLADHDTAS